jgi:hypothetical protein
VRFGWPQSYPAGVREPRSVLDRAHTAPLLAMITASRADFEWCRCPVSRDPVDATSRCYRRVS